jgi:hypothetical protein
MLAALRVLARVLLRLCLQTALFGMLSKTVVLDARLMTFLAARQLKVVVQPM